MKKSITLVLALVTAASVAQYNKTYDINGNTDFLVPSFVITNNHAESIALSIAYDAPGVPRTDYFIITKKDCNGKVIYNNRIYNNNSPTDGMTNVEALVETQQGDLLIAGYHYDDQQHIQQPMVIKVDPAGNLILPKKIYYVNQRDIFNAETNKISFCRVFDDPQENYFVVASGDSDNDPGNGVVVNVIKIDVNLNMMMNKKYYFGSDFRTVRDYPGDIEFSIQDKMYMITGYRQEIAPDGTQQDRMFFFGIDNNMNVLPPGFKTLQSRSIPVDEDMIYDQNTRDFAVTFTHNRNGYVPTANSVMGFLRIDPFLNVVGGTPKCFWHTNGTEHNARSISQCATGDYVICSGIFDPNTGLHNPAWLKVSNIGNAFAPLIRYNVGDDVYFGHHTTTFNCNSGSEEYILVNEHKTDLRVIRTDINGRVCGNRSYQPRMLDYTPQEKIYDYNIKDVGQPRDYNPIVRKWDPKIRECVPPGTSYRPSVATGIDQSENEGNGIALYPTVLSADNARLTMVNNSDEAIKIEMHNLAGQLIYSNANVATGKSEVQLNSNGNLSEGVYLVKIYDAKGSLNGATKIIVTK